MNRRSFLGSILALGAAPAIVRADSLMRVIPRNTGVIAAYDLTGNGRHLYARTSIYSHPSGEVLIFNTAHTEDQRRKVYEYLARKHNWGEIEDEVGTQVAWYQAEGAGIMIASGEAFGPLDESISR